LKGRQDIRSIKPRKKRLGRGERKKEGKWGKTGRPWEKIIAPRDQKNLGKKNCFLFSPSHQSGGRKKNGLRGRRG